MVGAAVDEATAAVDVGVDVEGVAESVGAGEEAEGLSVLEAEAGEIQRLRDDQ